MISDQLSSHLISILKKHAGQEVKINSISPVSGGDINEAFRLKTNAGDYFLKINDDVRFPGMFEKEARGLELLSKHTGLTVPGVIENGTAGNHAFLLMEFISSSGMQQNFWNDFAHGLADLHKSTADAFGLDHDNYIGSLPQYNDQHDNWISFFIEERLGKQLKLAVDHRVMGRQDIRSFEKLYGKLPEIFPEEPPVLLHGDLWSGNYMTGSRGEAVLIDPAVYYGHREMDLGMSKLFGGFSATFYIAYQEAYPLEKGWEKRLDICNLYPLLVHVNLFGGGYVSSVRNIISRF